MAKYFTQGTFTTETNYADAVRKAMVAGFTSAIAAGKTTWSIVDDGYVNTNFERTVFTCSSGTGFSVMVGNHNSSTTTHTFNTYIGKDYTLATHTLNKIGFGAGSQQTAGSDEYSTANYNPTAVSTSNIAPLPSISLNYVTIPSTISNWFIVVEDDYAIFSVKDGTSGVGTVWYFGAFETAVTNSSLIDSAPYCTAQNGANGLGSFSVHILTSLNNASKNIVHKVEASTNNINESGRPSSTTMYDVYKTGTKSVLTKIKLYRENISLSSVTNPNSDGHLRGILKGVAYASPTGAAWGDQIDVNGVTYLYAGGIASTVGTSGSTSAMAWWVAIN